jgi:hypothetical protein
VEAEERDARAATVGGGEAGRHPTIQAHGVEAGEAGLDSRDGFFWRRRCLTEAVDRDEQEAPQSVTELLERLGREVGDLALYEAQLEAARNMPEVRRAARDGAGAVVAAIAFAAAFVFGNVAAFGALATAWPAWLAGLVMAGAWVAVGALLALGLFGRVRRWRVWRIFATSPAEAVTELEQARDEAAAAVRETLAQVGPAITIEIATAAVPAAGDLAEGVFDASEDVVEAIAETLPAGSAVNQIWDVALMPGRFGLRVATTVLKRDDPARSSSDDPPAKPQAR